MAILIYINCVGAGWSGWCEKAQMVQGGRLGRRLLQVLSSAPRPIGRYLQTHLSQKTTSYPPPLGNSVSSCHSSENWNRRWCQSWNTRATRPTLTTTLRTTWTKFPVSANGNRESLMTFDHFTERQWESRTEEDCVVKSSFCGNVWIFQAKNSWGTRMGALGGLHKCYIRLSQFSDAHPADIFLQVQRMYFYKICKHISECSADIFLQDFLMYDLCSTTQESQEQYKSLNK